MSESERNNESSIFTLFGFPTYIGKISTSEYEKEKIIKTIEKNYEIDNKRNKWDDKNSDLHHTYLDSENEKFLKIDFSSLVSVYEKHIINFLNCLPSKVKFNYAWEIQNYTCFGRNQFMGRHSHIPAQFSAVHYINFDPAEHVSTCYYNPIGWSSVLDEIGSLRMMRNFFPRENTLNSWLYSNYTPNIKEDDFVITPAILEHGVLKSNSDKVRMAIVVNIHLYEQSD